MLCFVGCIRAKVPYNYAKSGRIMVLVKLLFYVGSNIFIDVVNSSSATSAQSMAYCCISSFISACLITALCSAVDIKISKLLQKFS